jgi:hypothetical protein
LELTNKTGYKNHPAVKMWKGYEPYLKENLLEFQRKGYKNIICLEKYDFIIYIK